MVVEVVLISATELEEVGAFQHGNVVTEHVVMPIPETATDLLIVHVERVELLTGLATGTLSALDFKRATKPGNLWRRPDPVPGPPIPQQTIMKVVGGVGGDVGGETRHEVPVLNRIARLRGWRAQRISGEKAPNINLGVRRKLHVVITPAGHEMVLGTEIVIDTRHVEVALDRQVQGAGVPQDIGSIAQALAARGVGLRLVLIPDLRNQRVKAEAQRITFAAGSSGAANSPDKSCH